jgi:hypothetical protein
VLQFVKRNPDNGKNTSNIIRIKKFNADTAIIYPLKLSEPYNDKYNPCKVLVIQRKGHTLKKLEGKQIPFLRGKPFKSGMLLKR